MTFINVKELAKLVGSDYSEEKLSPAVNHFHQKYNLKVRFEDLLNIKQAANRVNKREKAKQFPSLPSTLFPLYEIFCFGELKIFNWALILYCNEKNIYPQSFEEEDYEYLQSIFRKKSLYFIKYQLRSLIHCKKADLLKWTPEETDIFKQIIENFQCQQEWKAVSFELFVRSQGKYFRPFQKCREIWINHLNPNINKRDWTPKEDLDLFLLIVEYGCKWSLISRELKGVRSQHSVKNRYHSVVRSMKKQQKLGDKTNLNEKIIKYLKTKVENKIEEIQSLNDSVVSRQRSREEEKNQLNFSQSLEEPQKKEVQIQIEEEKEENILFNVLYENNQNSEIATPSTTLEDGAKLFKDNYLVQKEEKKTNDKDEDEEEVEKLAESLKETGEPRREVKTLTIEELDREYNRLMNFNTPERDNDLCMFDEVEVFQKSAFSNQWDDEEFKVSTWLDLHQ